MADKTLKVPNQREAIILLINPNPTQSHHYWLTQLVQLQFLLLLLRVTRDFSCQMASEWRFL